MSVMAFHLCSGYVIQMFTYDSLTIIDGHILCQSDRREQELDKPRNSYVFDKFDE